MEQILLTNDLFKETIKTRMMLNKTHKSKCLLTGWRRRLFEHCCWCSSRGYINPKSVHNLPRLRTSNADWSNESVLHAQKRQEADDIPHKLMLCSNSPAQAESLLHSIEKAASGIGLHVNADKTDYMYFKQKREISTLNGGSQKLRTSSRTSKITSHLLKVISTCDKGNHGLL